jgi:F420-dependent oxidoreductase-like protein
VGYYAQEHDNLRVDETLLDNIRLEVPTDVHLSETELRGLLGMFGLSGDKVFQDAGTLSGGEKTKLALAMLMVGRNNVLLLDEPTNNLDPGSRHAVTDALRDWPGAIILVSHDTEFVEQLGPTKVLVMPDGELDYFGAGWLDLVALARPPSECWSAPECSAHPCRAFNTRVPSTVGEMRIGLFGTRVTDGTIDDVVEEARQAEADGFATYWASQIFGHDALTALAIVGREVSRIELGTSVVPTYPRHPMVLAQQALSVSAATGGRFCLGVGLSHQIVIETMMGMSFAKPVRHLREYLTVLGALSRGEPVAFDGEDYRVHAALSVAGAAPFPIVVAALGSQTLKVTAELADGTLTWCTGPGTLAGHTIPTLNAAAEAAGRPAPRVIAALPVCVTADAAGARERAAKVFSIYGQLPSYRAMLDREGVEGPADIAIVGSPTEVTDRIAALADIGVTDFAAVEFGAEQEEREATRAAVLAAIS